MIYINAYRVYRFTLIYTNDLYNVYMYMDLH